MSRETAFALKPRRIGEVLDLTFRIFRHRFSRFAVVGVLMGVANTTGYLLLQASLYAGGAFPDPAADPTGFLVSFYSAYPLFLTSALLVYSVGAAVMFATTRDVLVGPEGGGGSGLAEGWTRIPSMFLTALLSWIVILLGLVLCLLPGIFAAVVFALAVPVAFLERRSPFSAIGRSVQLVHSRGPRGLGADNNGVRVLAIGLVSVVVWYALNLLASIPQAAAMVAGMSGNRGMVSTAIGPSPLPLAWMLPTFFLGAVLQGMFLGIVMIPWVVLYYDIRVRHEGLDMEMRIRRLRAGPE